MNTPSPDKLPQEVREAIAEAVSFTDSAFLNSTSNIRHAKIADAVAAYLAPLWPSPAASEEKSPGHTYAEWKQYQEIEKLLDDTATLCRRLVRAVGKDHPLYKQANDFLQENDLTGSPLRIPTAAAPKDSGSQKAHASLDYLMNRKPHKDGGAYEWNPDGPATGGKA